MPFFIDCQPGIAGKKHVFLLATEESFAAVSSGDSALAKHLQLAVVKDSFAALGKSYSGAPSFAGSFVNDGDNSFYVHVMNVGKDASVTLDKVRGAAHAGVTTLRGLGVTSGGAIVVPHVAAVHKLTPMAMARAMASAATLSNYSWNVNVTNDSKKTPLLESLTLVVGSGDGAIVTTAPDAKNAASYVAVASSGGLVGTVQDAVNEAVLLGHSTNYARDLGNTRANVGTTRYYADAARALVSKFDPKVMKVTVLEEDVLKAEGMGMLVAVGQAAVEKSRLVILEYFGDAGSTRKVGLVGKGIVMDTGGLNLKTQGGIEHMHMDMCGAAGVLGTFHAAATTKLKKNLVGVLALAENAISEDAYKPGEIVKSYKGLTVEVLNTDAEGRLVLGDALAYTEAKYSPHTIIDMATLTGAVVVALGHETAACFAKDNELAADLAEASAQTANGESCWRMPTFAAYDAEMADTPFADIKNLGSRAGGSCTAAAFLRNFADETKTKYAHLDIAGAGMFDKPKSFNPAGATGFGPNLLHAYLKASN